MSWTNYHAHCLRCDGAASLEDFIRSAVGKDLPSCGISPHAPLSLPTEWALTPDQLTTYLTDIQRLRLEWSGEIEILAGLEVDYLPGLDWWEQIGPQYRDLDYVIGSVHLLDRFPDGSPFVIDGSRSHFEQGLAQIFEGDVQAAATRYYELVRWMIMLENPDIVGHLDKFKIHNAAGNYFSENEDWYRAEINKTLDVIAKYGSIVEVNTRGLYSGKSLDLYPSQWILERIHDLRIPVVLNSDAHRPEELTAGFGIAARVLKNIGFQTLSILSDNSWIQVPFDEDGLQLPWENQLGNKSA